MEKNIVEILNELNIYSSSIIEDCEDLHSNNEEIRWYANYCPPLDEKVIDYYMSEQYAKKTRYDLFIDSIFTIKELNIDTLIDIGSGNGFFPYLINTKTEIESYGIEPRKNLVINSNNFYSSKIDSDKNILFCGNIRTFNECIKKYKIKVGCITILNFLHGNDHDFNEINELFSILDKITNYIIISEPQKMPNSSFRRIKDIGYNKQHGLYTNLDY